MRKALVFLFLFGLVIILPASSLIEPVNTEGLNVTLYQTINNFISDVWDISSSKWLYNNSGVLEWNETLGDMTYQSVITGNCTGKVMIGVYVNGSPICEPDDTGGGGGADGQGIYSSDGVYLYDNSTEVFFNESKLNSTIISLADTTQDAPVGYYYDFVWGSGGAVYNFSEGGGGFVFNFSN